MVSPRLSILSSPFSMDHHCMCCTCFQLLRFFLLHHEALLVTCHPSSSSLASVFNLNRLSVTRTPCSFTEYSPFLVFQFLLVQFLYRVRHDISQIWSCLLTAIIYHNWFSCLYVITSFLQCCLSVVKISCATLQTVLHFSIYIILLLLSNSCILTFTVAFVWIIKKCFFFMSFLTFWGSHLQWVAERKTPLHAHFLYNN